MTRLADPAAAMNMLLEQQRSALLAGDVAALAALPDRLANAMRQLAASGSDPGALRALAQMAGRNAQLVLSAREGLARARRDATPSAPLTTYDAQGRRAVDAPQGQLISRR